MCIYTYVYVCASVKNVYIYIYIHVSIQVYIQIHICICTYGRKTEKNARMYVCICIHNIHTRYTPTSSCPMYVCTYMYVHGSTIYVTPNLATEGELGHMVRPNKKHPDTPC